MARTVIEISDESDTERRPARALPLRTLSRTVSEITDLCSDDDDDGGSLPPSSQPVDEWASRSALCVSVFNKLL